MSYESDMNRARDIVRELSAIFDRYDEEITPGPVPPTEQAKAITSLLIETEEDAVPITWGQVFKVGDVQPGDPLMARWPDGSNTQLQVDVKASHADGSVRHAIISTIAVGGKLEIVKGAPKTELGGIKTMYTHAVTIVLDGITYTASVIGKDRWLDGPIVTEYNGAVPFADKDGKQHPHLHLRTAIRCYAGETTRFDFCIENDWAYEPDPQNFTYDVEIEIGGVKVYEKSNLTNLHHSRWRRVFWSGAEPQIHIQHDTTYLIGSRALPNYDQTLTVPEKTLAEWDAKWKKAGDEPMTVGLAMKAMGTTGGRADIGLNPAWTVTALLTNDKRVMEATIGTATLAGSWAMHYRDKDTDQPISLIDYPYMTILGNRGDTRNPNRIDPVTNKKGVQEAFPIIANKDNPTPHSHDVPHQPNFSYVPYLLTGDFYHLEELQFWAMYNVFSSNPGYRQNIKGLLKPGQVRGQAWALRTLAEAAYITPDDDRLKEHFIRVMGTNFDWYIENYSKGGEFHNPLGALINGYAVVYLGQTAVGPWQDDFFTQAVGHAAELHPNSRAKELLDIKVKFVEERLLGKGANWLAAASYTYPVRATATGPIFTIGEAYAALRASLDPVKDKVTIERLEGGGNDMGGYPTSTAGYPANMQPAVSYASKAAWQQFEKRDPKPNYGTSPQFAIVPRTV